MAFNQDLIQRIYNDRQPKSKKQIIYFVGATGCGKSTKLKKLQQTYLGFYQYITHDEIMSFLLHQPNVFARNLSYLYLLSDRLMKAIDNTETSNQNTIFVEGHPILSILYSQALFKSQKGVLITEKDCQKLMGCYNEIIEYINGYEPFQKFHQIIYYINLPLEVNLELLQQQRGCDYIEENEKNELELIRRTIHSDIFNLTKQISNTKVIEVNTLMGLDMVHMYLLGRSSC